ncbi:MAG TPA: amidohydrolase family protein [Acidimicrobiales bacterium]|nr:amidohydrolase family protein [Acidimicrobiales bacterium]
MKIWANSGDSHYMEPKDLYDALPPELAARMPRSVKSADGTTETIYVDGKSFERPLPRIGIVKGKNGRTLSEALRAPGDRDFEVRRSDLDHEGIWAEVIYPSVGLWNSMITDPVLAREAVKVINDWCASVQQESIRHVMPAQISPLDVGDGVAEVQRAAGLGLKAVGLPSGTPPGIPDFNRPYWEPLWDAMDETGMVIAVHTGNTGEDPVHFHGPGAGPMNYVWASYPGMTMAGFMVASGVLDRHPNLKLLISEAGASWVPFLGDRLNEAYRQHSEFVKDRLSRLPKEILFDQVYASFQHDESAIPALTAMGYRNVVWGSDYPHLEGTFGHTQKTLHELFDDQPDDVRYRITQGSFLDLFPHVGSPPREGLE